MALPCYAQHSLCLHRSLQNCCYCPYKVILLYNSLYLKKKEYSIHVKNNSGTSSGKQCGIRYLNENSPEKPATTEVVIAKNENKCDDLSVLEEPTTCCMSGCANCVWIEYAEELSKRFRDGGEKAREAIMKISDPNMRAFLLTELKTIKKS